jgi:hypothetical protein
MKRPKLSDKFPCECGHSKELHEMTGPPINDGWCNWDRNEKSSEPGYALRHTCACNWYVPDNLKYLEQCLKKKRGK